MLTRFVLFQLFFALSFPGCEKRETGPKPEAAPTQPPASSAAPRSSATPATVAAATPVAPKPAIDLNAQVVIFGYHRFVNSVRHPDTEITPAAFEEQMKELKDKGVAVIGMQDFLAWKRGEKAIPSRAAIVTLPVGVLKTQNVEFDPSLPEKRRAAAALGIGEATKVVLRFRKRFWPQKFGFVHTFTRSFPTWWTNEDPLVLTGWAGGPR